MEFETVLEQTLALLQRQGRISYGALKRRFQLDDTYLEDLKVELIEAQRLAYDENGGILVWAGETASQPLARDDQAIQAQLIHVERRTPDAERRQLTVMFCDLVDSTLLASQLDPEDWREVVRAYQETAAAVIQRFDGHIAQYLGDGLLVYFGFPQAHEDDAHRAVRTGLDVVEALGTLNTRLAQPYGVQLTVRMGIHTGLVVIGEMGGGSRQEQLALGDTPNVAARIQGLAAPDTVVISPATFRLVRGFFHSQDLGLQWQRDEAPEAKFDKLERVLRTYRLPLEDSVPLFAVLLALPLPERYPPLNLTPQRQRQKTHEALVAWLLEEAERQPVLAVWEDLHWADPSTIEVLSLTLDQVPIASMLTLLTCRPEFRPPWATYASVAQVTVNRLGRSQVEAMIASLTDDKPLPTEIVEQIIAKTDGVPLFVEELVKMILESGLVQEHTDGYVLAGPLPPLAIPSTLHDSLMARLDRLSTARELVQLGAVLGREFAYELLQAVAPEDEKALQ
jgi:class 3 adenylate cyclase